MHCKKCNANAVINMRHHKLALCGEHYGEWFLGQTDRAIEKYKMFTRDERVLVAVSGGKDSLSLWDALLRLGYRADGLYIGLGINDPAPYSDVSLEKTRAFLASDVWRVSSDEENSASPVTRHTPLLHVVDIAQTYGKTIPQISREQMRGRGR
ncbi:partial tRNA-5-methyluridine(54) 2-sulfurtransferase, partial [Gammaproteobacteria bacterium]